MPDNALASMFGGLGEFIKLRRGFRQETAEEARAKDDHALRQALGRQAQQRGEIDIKYLPGQYQNEILRTQHSIFGPTTEMGKQFGAAHNLDPAATNSLSEGITKAIRKRDAELGAAESQATIAGNQAKASVHAPTLAEQQVTAGQQGIDLGKMNLANVQDQRGARDLIRKNPSGLNGVAWNPKSNSEHARLFALADLDPGITFDDKTRSAIQVNSASAAASGAAQFANQKRLMELGLPPGVDIQAGNNLKQLLLSLDRSAGEVGARLKTMDPRLLQAAGIRRNSPQGMEMAARFNGARQRELEGLGQQAAQIDQLLDKYGVTDPRARLFYKTEVGNIMAGVPAADEEKAPAPTPVTPAAGTGGATSRPPVVLKR